MELNQNQVLMATGVLTEGINAANARMRDISAIYNERDEVEEAMENEFAVHMAQIESCSTVILFLSDFLSDSDYKKSLVSTAQANLAQTKRFFTECGIKYETRPILLK